MAKTVRAILGDIYDAWRVQNLVIHIPITVHPLGGTRHGKKLAIERWGAFMQRYEILCYDTTDLIVERNRAAVEIPVHYRDKETGAALKTTKANFWTMEDAWPVKLTEYYDVSQLQAFFSPSAPPAEA